MKSVKREFAWRSQGRQSIFKRCKFSAKSKVTLKCDLKTDICSYYTERNTELTLVAFLHSLVLRKLIVQFAYQMSTMKITLIKRHYLVKVLHFWGRFLNLEFNTSYLIDSFFTRSRVRQFQVLEILHLGYRAEWRSHYSTERRTTLTFLTWVAVYAELRRFKATATFWNRFAACCCLKIPLHLHQLFSRSRAMYNRPGLLTAAGWNRMWTGRNVHSCLYFKASPRCIKRLFC